MHDKVVIRGGYGVYHSRSTGQPFLQLISAPPYGQFRIFSSLAAGPFSEQQPLPLETSSLSDFYSLFPDDLKRNHNV